MNAPTIQTVRLLSRKFSSQESSIFSTELNLAKESREAARRRHQRFSKATLQNYKCHPRRSSDREIRRWRSQRRPARDDSAMTSNQSHPPMADPIPGASLHFSAATAGHRLQSLEFALEKPSNRSIDWF